MDIVDAFRRSFFGLIFNTVLIVLLAIAVLVCWPLLPDHMMFGETLGPKTGYFSLPLIVGVVGWAPLLMDGRVKVTLGGLEQFRTNHVVVAMMSLPWFAAFAVKLYGDVKGIDLAMHPQIFVPLMIFVFVCVGIGALAMIR